VGRRKQKQVKRYQKDLRGVDPGIAAYWTELLRREGLTMDAGRNRRVIYVGNSNDLEGIVNKVIRGEEGPIEDL